MLTVDSVAIECNHVPYAAAGATVRVSTSLS